MTSDIVETMEPTSSDRLPDDVLVVEDDPIIALDLEDTLLGLGIKTVRIAATVAKAMAMIAGRAPDFALLDVGLIREKSFAIAERVLSRIPREARTSDSFRNARPTASSAFALASANCVFWNSITFFPKASRCFTNSTV